MTRRGVAVVAVVMVMVLVACSGGDGETSPTQTTEDLGQNRPSTLPPRSTIEPASTTGVETTTVETTVVETSVPPVGRLTPEDLGPLVDPASVPDAPGMPVPGEVVEIYPMVWLYLPSVFSADDRSVIPPKPEDIDILVGYGRATAAWYEQVTQNPVSAEPNAAIQATHADGGVAIQAQTLSVLSANGTYGAFPDGRPNIYRPSVLTSPRTDTTALVADCLITGGGLVYADGTPVDPVVLEPWAPPYGSLTEMVKVDGVWKIATRGVASPAVCQ
jgi:hypothetical protein